MAMRLESSGEASDEPEWVALGPVYLRKQTYLPRPGTSGRCEQQPSATWVTKSAQVQHL